MRKFYNIAKINLLYSLLILLSITILTYTSFTIRDIGLLKFTERSKPLIEAINKFDKENGRKPNNLKELEPDFFSDLEKIKMGGYRMPILFINEDTSFFLSVRIPIGIMDMATLIYTTNKEFVETNKKIKNYNGWIIEN